MEDIKVFASAIISCYITEKRIARASKLPRENMKRTTLREEFKRDGEKYSDSDASLVSYVYKRDGNIDSLTTDRWYFSFIPRHIWVKEFRADGNSYHVRFSAHGGGDIGWTLDKGSSYLPIVAAGQLSPRLPKEAEEELLRIRAASRDEYICCYFWRFKKEKDNDGWHVETLPKGGGVVNVRKELVKVINEMTEERARLLLERIRREEATAKSILAYALESEKKNSNGNGDVRQFPPSQSLFPDANIPYTLR